MDKKRCIVIIPARLGSTRLPRKVLADIRGKPLIWYVWKQVCQAKNFDQVIITTDASEVENIVRDFGAQVMMSSSECRSGTERIASLLPQVDADFIINVQGDEPFVDPLMLDSLVQGWEANACDLITPVFRIHSLTELQNPNLVKVVRARDGRALYFSRSAVPFVRDVPLENWLKHSSFWGHIGVYGYKRSVLEAYSQLPHSLLEETERLEQLRFLEAGYTFQTVETDYRPVAVDVIEDLEKVRQMIQ